MTYHVDASDPRFRAIYVRDWSACPTADASALLQLWDRQGFRSMSRELASHLGATVVVLRDPADAVELIGPTADSQSTCPADSPTLERADQLDDPTPTVLRPHVEDTGATGNDADSPILRNTLCVPIAKTMAGSSRRRKLTT